MFYVLKIRGYRYLGRLYPFKKRGHLKVTIYAIYRHKDNAKRDIGLFRRFSDSVELLETQTITRDMFLRQHSACTIFEGCEAKIPHECKNDYPIHLWYDPAQEGVGYFCEDAITEMAKTRYPFHEI